MPHRDTEHLPIHQLRKKLQKQSPQTIAVFDFDHTLIKQDSLFLLFFRGFPFHRIIMNGLLFLYFITIYGLSYIVKKVFSHTPSYDAFHTIAKRAFARAVFKNMPTETLQTIVEQHIRPKIKFKRAIIQKIQEHDQNGDVVIILSGCFTALLRILCKDLPHDVAIGTDLMTCDDLFTGEIKGKNRISVEKSVFIYRFLRALGYDAYHKNPTLIGYGNCPQDRFVMYSCNQFMHLHKRSSDGTWM